MLFKNNNEINLFKNKIKVFKTLLKDYRILSTYGVRRKAIELCKECVVVPHPRLELSQLKRS